MSPSQRYRWFIRAGGVTLIFGVASLVLPRGPFLSALSDVVYFLLTLSVALAMLRNASLEKGENRRFWLLMASGCLLWACDLGAWIYYEVLRHANVPVAWFMDIFLFLHLVPMIAAVGLRPHRAESEGRIRGGTFEFLLLLVWWVFLYAFVVFPSQYIVPDKALYQRSFATLYLVEVGVLVLVLGISARGAPAGWKILYVNLLAASALYALDSQGLSLALHSGKYYTGSLYDIPLIGTVAWMAATALSARDWPQESVSYEGEDVWGAIALWLTVVAILSLPALGLWTLRWDDSPALTRAFRLFTVLAAMLVLGVFVFMRQYFQDQTLIDLLAKSRRSFETRTTFAEPSGATRKIGFPGSISGWRRAGN